MLNYSVAELRYTKYNIKRATPPTIPNFTNSNSLGFRFTRLVINLIHSKILHIQELGLHLLYYLCSPSL